jgi:hypothetical protein
MLGAQPKGPISPVNRSGLRGDRTATEASACCTLSQGTSISIIFRRRLFKVGLNWFDMALARFHSESTQFLSYTTPHSRV